MSNDPSEIQRLWAKVEQLQVENEQLKQRLEPLLGPHNPCFDKVKFQAVVRRLILVMVLPTSLLSIALVIGAALQQKGIIPKLRIGPVAVLDIGGMTSGIVPGIGIGIVAVGGAAIGVFAFGGGSFGIIASGGGSMGIVAVGGGAVGLIAIGGGALGYVAIGGGACGIYAMAIQNGYGRYVLSMKRQDQEAIDFFVRWIPGLRAVVTNPMPVIPIARS
jgi:hypothetical protein